MDMSPEAQSQIGRRRDSRLRLHIPARLDTIHASVQAQLLDLSQSGAHLAVAEQLVLGEDTLLRWLSFEGFGRVVWATPKQVGLEFDELLLPATLVTTRDLADQSTAKKDRRRAYEAAKTWYQGNRL